MIIINSRQKFLPTYINSNNDTNIIAEMEEIGQKMIEKVQNTNNTSSNTLLLTMHGHKQEGYKDK